MTWIKVDDQKPEPWKNVLIWSPKYNSARVGFFSGFSGNFKLHGGDYDEKITHWQPLPEKP